MTWRKLAACAGADSDLFYPEPRATAQIARALAICHACPVQAECLAAGRHDDYGIWGGTTPEQRLRINGPCGTPAGYWRHYQLGRTPCDDCKSAHRAAKRAQYRKKALS